MTPFIIAAAVLSVIGWIATYAEKVYFKEVRQKPASPIMATPRCPGQGDEARRVSELFAQATKREKLQDKHNDLSAVANLTQAQEAYLAKLQKEINDDN